MAVITVRLDNALHAAVKELAYQRRTNINRLVCDMLVSSVATQPDAQKILEEFDDNERSASN